METNPDELITPDRERCVQFNAHVVETFINEHASSRGGMSLS
jgi:hypothetical protein